MSVLKCGLAAKRKFRLRNYYLVECSKPDEKPNKDCAHLYGGERPWCYYGPNMQLFCHGNKLYNLLLWINN